MPTHSDVIAALSDATLEAGLRRQQRRTAAAVFALSQLFGIGLLVAVRVLDVRGADAATLLLGEAASLACGALIAALVYVNLGHALQRRHQAIERATELAAGNTRLKNDVAELRQAQERLETRLRDAERQHRQWLEALDAVPEPIFLHDDGHRLLQANRAYRECAGVAQVPHDRPYWEVFPPLPGPLPGCARLVEEDQAGVVEDEFSLADGRAFISHACRISDRESARSYSIHILEDVTERRAAEAKIRQYAQHDALTGLPNRVLFEDRFEQAVLRASRHGGVLALMVLDLDRFKPVNDTYGHAVGDELLKTIARRLQGCVRKTDTVVRFGGDEFVILLSEVNDRRVHDLIASKAAAVIESVGEPVPIGEHTISVGVSIGIALHPGDGDSLRALLHAADQAMYAVKEHGRNDYAFAGQATAG